MPIVRITLWPGRTEEQKATLAKEITDLMVKVARTRPEDTTIIFEEIPKENWAVAGQLASLKVPK